MRTRFVKQIRGLQFNTMVFYKFRCEKETKLILPFFYDSRTEVGEDEITYHIGMLISPSTTRNSDQVKFVWNLNLDAPNSNTIIFTVMSVKSWTEDCSKLGKRGMLIVKPAKSRKRKKNRGRTEEPDSINTCLSELTKGDKLRFHSLKAKVVFYTTHLRKYALTLEYEPGKRLFFVLLLRFLLMATIASTLLLIKKLEYFF